MVKTMCEKAGIDGKKTNHSLRVAHSTRLYRALFPEKMIADRMGSRSVSAHKYQRSNFGMHVAASQALSGKRPAQGELQEEEKKVLKTSISPAPAPAPAAPAPAPAPSPASAPTPCDPLSASKQVVLNFSGSFENCTIQLGEILKKL
jgi:hypothetical protein